MHGLSGILHFNDQIDIWRSRVILEKKKDMHIRQEILVKGRVQKVGYRDRIQLLAREYAITGFIKNLEGYDVLIVAEGTKEDLRRFCSAIQISEYPIKVDSIEIQNLDYSGEFPYFQITRGSSDEELAERFDTALLYLAHIDYNCKRVADNSDLMLGKQDQALEIQSKILEEQGQMIDLQKRVFLSSMKQLPRSEGNEVI